MSKKWSEKYHAVLLKLRNVFSHSSKNDLIGGVLVKKKVITADELKQVLAIQEERIFAHGKAEPLSRIVVEQGLGSEKDILRAVNDYYNIKVASLTDNFNDMVKKVRGAFHQDKSAIRMPIWVQLSVTILFVLAVTVAAFGYIIMERQKEKLFENTWKVGMVSLYYFRGNAKIPLLNDDILELNALINEASSVDGQYYAFIVDTKDRIRAHTDHSKIDTVFEPFRNVERVYKRGGADCLEYLSKDKGRILNLSMPIIFSGKQLGAVHVGLSIDFVTGLFNSERTFLAGSILVIILFGMVVGVLFSLRFSRPLSALVKATEEIGGGNYTYKVDLARRNDELGALGHAFNQMGDELYRQSMMKETFGKYVGADVLDMIMRNPGSSWLKGRRNEVSVLFADIRGFTAYSEGKEPEEVVEKLNEFFEIATGAVMRYGGYVDKFMGDAVLAVFGVPVYHNNHSERCLRAALDMRREFQLRDPEHNPLLRLIGIGLASGVVVAGNIGSQVKTEYTVIGDCVNVAAYLNSRARAGEILIGNGMGKHFGHLIEVEALAAQNIKGKEERVPIYRVVAEKND